MQKETVEEFLARGGKITVCKTGKAKNSEFWSKKVGNKYAVAQKGRKKVTVENEIGY